MSMMCNPGMYDNPISVLGICQHAGRVFMSQQEVKERKGRKGHEREKKGGGGKKMETKI